MLSRPSKETAIRDALTRVGTSLCGRYQITGLIGLGGMAAVYSGVHRNGHRVAIKILHDWFGGETEAERLFRREAQLANRVGHGGAVPVTDDDVTEDGRIFLVMPLLEGETVRARAERHGGKLPLVEVAQIAHATLETLAAAHAQKIVHRDIKPDNLFVTTDGGLKVLDFGIGRFFERTETGTATQTGGLVGTPAFMAPEQALGRTRLVDGQTDIWAVAATMFTLLSGELVHPGENTAELAAFAATRSARSLREAAPHAPAGMGAVVDRALRFDKADRFPTAEAMAEALREAWRADAGSELSELPTLRAPTGTVPYTSAANATTRPALPLETPHAQATSGRPARETAGNSGDSRKDRVPSEVDRHLLSQATRGAETAAANRAADRAADPKSRWRKRSAVIAFSLLGAGVAAGAGRRVANGGGAMLSPAREAESTQGADGSSASRTVDAAALASYHQGLQLWLDGAETAAMASFNRALQQDPNLAAAHLMAAIAPLYDDPQSVRRHLLAASSGRSQMEPQFQQLLDALEPEFAEPEDLVQAGERCGRLAASADDRYVELACASLALRAFHPTAAIEIAGGLPSPASLWVGARAQLQRGDAEAARALAEECWTVSPHATNCVTWLAQLDANEGRCAAAGERARELIAQDPEGPYGYQLLADAVFGDTHSTAATRPIVARRIARLPEPRRKTLVPRMETLLRVFDGDFKGALQSLEEWQQSLSASTNGIDQSFAHGMRVSLHLELDQQDAAGAAARAFDAERRGWLSTDGVDAPFWAAQSLYLTSRISRVEYVKRRDEELRIRDARGGYFVTGMRWNTFFAEVLKSKEDVADAVRTEPPKSQLLDLLFRDQSEYAHRGRFYQLAGRSTEALETLRLASRGCSLWSPVEAVQSHLWLGQVLAQTGKHEEACAEFKFVLDRWGHEPRSVTARAARTASRGCSWAR